MNLLQRVREWRKEKKIQAAVVKHCQRNFQLREVLLSHNVKLAEQRTIDLHFWAQGREAAERLSNALASLGYPVSRTNPSSDGQAVSNSCVWNVESSVLLTPSLTLSASFTEEMVRLAAGHNAIYDGWGTAIDPVVQSS